MATTTITISQETKAELLKIAAELQGKLKRKISYDDAIKYLLFAVRRDEKNPNLLKQACTPDADVDPKTLVRDLLQERKRDERR